MPMLDERLRTALEMTPACARAADVGADHGKFSAAMLSEGRASFMVVADVSAKALSRARRRLTALGLSARAAFRVADGLDAVRGDPVDAAVVLGMGGPTICDILSRGRDALCGAALVLGPHTLPEDVRRRVSEIGYRIREERIARAAGRLYVVMRAEAGEEALSERACYLGPRFLEMAEGAGTRGGAAMDGEAAGAACRAASPSPDALARYREWLLWRRDVLRDALSHQMSAVSLQTDALSCQMDALPRQAPPAPAPVSASFPVPAAGKPAAEGEYSLSAASGAADTPVIAPDAPITAPDAPVIAPDAPITAPPSPRASTAERLQWVEETLALPALALKGDQVFEGI